MIPELFFHVCCYTQSLRQSKKIGFTEMFGRNCTALGACCVILTGGLVCRFWRTTSLLVAHPALIAGPGFGRRLVSLPKWLTPRHRCSRLLTFGLSRIQDYGLVLNARTWTLFWNQLSPSYLWYYEILIWSSSRFLGITTPKIFRIFKIMCPIEC